MSQAVPSKGASCEGDQVPSPAPSPGSPTGSSTVGIGWGSDSASTRIVTLHWDTHAVTPGDVHLESADDQVVGHFLNYPDAAVAVTVPLGWPLPLVSFLHQQSVRVLPPIAPPVPPASVDVGEQFVRPLMRRRCDDMVEALAHVPAPACVTEPTLTRALRFQHLLARYCPAHATAPRDGTGLIEVHPEAALAAWGLPWRHLRAPGDQGQRARERTLAGLLDPGWLDLGGVGSAVVRDPATLEALVAALAARAVRAGVTVPAAAGPEREMAEREGWTALPSQPFPGRPWPLP